MIGTIVNNIVQHCEKIIDTDYLQQFSQIVAAELGKYDIQEKHYEIVPWDEQVSKGYMMFFVAKKVEGLSHKSLSYYRSQIDKMAEFVQKPFDKITTDDIRFYLAAKQTRDGISETTTENIRHILNSFFSWMTAEGYCPKNPVYPIKPIKRKKIVHHAFTDTELEKIRDHCKTIKNPLSRNRALAIVETFLSTGCRVGELTGLKISDVNFQSRTAVVFGKGKKERRVYFNERAMLRISEYLNSRGDDGGEWLFVTDEKCRKHLSSGGVRTMLKEIGKAAGVSKVHPHKFRRTAATIALRRGMKLTDIQRMLGHANLETTKIYLDMDDSDLEAQHRKFM